MKSSPDTITIRNTQAGDFSQIIEMTRVVYPTGLAWSEEQLRSHLRVFPEGQFVAVKGDSEIVGMAASLIILWDDYDLTGSWRDFTGHGMFTNHDPEKGRTLYGAEVMVHPSEQGKSIGKQLYGARRLLVEQLGLLRIRAGARLRNYHLHADRLTAEQYCLKVVTGEVGDPTLSFQLKQGFHVLAVVPAYLRHDPESRGFAAVIEWLNTRVAGTEDYLRRDQSVQRLVAAANHSTS
jgi:predicted N-acetyltransferase YhbS